jgi:hypothetical protein
MIHAGDVRLDGGATQPTQDGHDSLEKTEMKE